MTNALALPALGGSLESYIQSANSFPILSQEEETNLARRLWNYGDLEAAQ